MRNTTIRFFFCAAFVGCSPLHQTNDFDKSDVCISDEQFQKVSKEISEYEETATQIFKKIIERLPDADAKSSTIDRRIKILDEMVEQVKESFPTEGAVHTKIDEIDKRLQKMEASVRSDSEVAELRAIKALFRETIVPVRKGLKIEIAFSKPIVKGLRDTNDSFTLNRDGKILTIQIATTLKPEGEILVVELEDRSLHAIRLMNVTKGQAVQNTIYINDPADGEFHCGSQFISRSNW